MNTIRIQGADNYERKIDSQPAGPQRIAYGSGGNQTATTIHHD